MKLRPVCLASALILLFAVQIPAYCSSDSEAGVASSDGSDTSDKLADMSMEDLMNVRISAASKREEAVSHTPASVFVITRDDIERYGYRTLGDALRRVAGFYTSNDLSYTYVGVRGYSRPDDYNSRILILLDGHKLNEIVYKLSTTYLIKATTTQAA